MALATRCPSCLALFRVAPDQLKLRGGLVRCGACRHVFDAIGTLSYIDDATLAASPPAAQPAVGAVIAAIRKAETTVGEAMAAADAAEPGMAPQARQGQVEAEYETQSGVEDSAEPQRVTMPVAEALVVAEVAGEPQPTEAAAARIEAELPAATEAVAAVDPASVDMEAAPEPSFLQEHPAPKKRGSRMLLGAGALVLALLALAQLAVAFRAEIAASVPQARPALGQLCRLFGCTVGWPARADMLAVVGTELQALPGTSAFELTAVVRNRGQVTLELPAIELALSDTLNRTVARRVFTPADYLAGASDAASQLEAGLAAGADLTVRVAFEARGVNAAGFVVYPFYL
jgi:predicted Zn finger-like uncharacterized protein